jgi:TRAP-type C4-dicarboxylate transport system substrate-binding protein
MIRSIADSLELLTETCLRPANLALWLSIAALLSPATAAAEPVTLRMAAIAPEGTPWARELRTMAREVEARSEGQLRIKWYLSGIAGDELTALERMRHGQLDGMAGASFCERIAPSLRATRVVGLYRDRDEVAYVLANLKSVLDEEMRHSGFEGLLYTVFGADIMFTRRPVRSMEDVRSLRWYMWTLSPIYRATLTAMGVPMVVMPVEQIASRYQRGDIDGFTIPPSAALAFQWSTVASYFTPLETAMLPACVVLTHAAMDPLTIEQQELIRMAAAKLRVRITEVCRNLDLSLINGMFEKQGLKKVPVTPQLRQEFFEAARKARDQLDESLLPKDLLNRVLGLLADYRAEHAVTGSQ